MISNYGNSSDGVNTALRRNEYSLRVYFASSTVLTGHFGIDSCAMLQSFIVLLSSIKEVKKLLEIVSCHFCSYVITMPGHGGNEKVIASPYLMIIASVPLKCFTRHTLTRGWCPYQKQNLGWSSCPFKNEAHRFMM